jgi:hypothetical protein
VVLTLLEVAVELAELRHGPVPFDEEVLSWAADERLFEEDDWIRFHTLWTHLRMLTGRSEEALAAVRLAERQGELPAADAALLLSQALEELGEKTRAGAEARRRLSLLDKPWPAGEVVRAAHLLGASDLLEEALGHYPAGGEDAALVREALGAPPLVALGKKSD